ncbi:MAG: heparan-alpha-glucosaminide N-acetyltransferase domain-containing protein [Candidatus Krumholzibacteria bacterium]|nr:heparan-alpha-glucosaminide N-acetyltransferase domain-containing protein [Candidatus Krumholzibacteria bacterium]
MIFVMKNQRLISLDVFRGLTVALMILVNTPGSWAHIHPPLRHAAWQGWTPTDLVFAFFLFAVGVAISLSFRRRLETGAAPGDLVRKVLMRAAIIFVLGLLLNGFPYDKLGELRVWGVLQRIAVCYLIAGLTVVLVRRRNGRLAVMLGLLLGYELLMRLPLIAAWGNGSFALEDNFVRRIDLIWPGAVHLYQGKGLPFDPEGLLSSLPAAAGTLAGFFTGEYLHQDRPLSRRLVGLALGGTLLTATGLLLGFIEPINKQLWTVSYTVLTTGLALLTLAACGWLIDVRRWQRWAGPALVFGSNALVAFVGSGLLVRILLLIKITGPDGAQASLSSTLYKDVFLPLAGPVNGSFLYALSTVVLWWALLWLLYRRRIFIKI